MVLVWIGPKTKSIWFGIEGDKRKAISDHLTTIFSNNNAQMCRKGGLQSYGFDTNPQVQFPVFTRPCEDAPTTAIRQGCAFTPHCAITNSFKRIIQHKGDNKFTEF